MKIINSYTSMELIKPNIIDVKMQVVTRFVKHQRNNL